MTGLFGTSGIRRRVEEFTEEFVKNLAMSLGTYSKDSEIAIGIDTRNSSPLLESWFISGLIDTGHNIIRLGIVPTPTLGIAAQDYGTGVMITASHNPPEYNGFKFWNSNGAYTEEMEHEIEKIFYSGKFNKRGGEFSIIEKDYVEKHIDRILRKVGNVEKEIRVLIDCANGSGSVITPELLGRMGCDVIAINTELNGNFPHGLEPTAENLRETCELVRKFNAEIGIAHDGDADRAAVIDKNGRLVDWDDFLAVLAYGRRRVVTTVDASMKIENVCGKIIRTKIGDVAVANAIRRENAEFGGEPSGSMIFPDVHLFPDGVLTAAIVAKMVSDGRFYEILDNVRKMDYKTERIKIPYSGNREDLMKKIRENINDVVDGEVSYVDGIRIRNEDSWLLIRPSGTEPVIRITAEAKDNKTLRELVENAEKLVKEIIAIYFNPLLNN
ncbi:MAG: phosphoglucosamine mutase [Candidatus Altiarchaeales archaeon]|nr:MAG: phosphoglucosamine mutase [Candidatus Altiarchaeales archaeon]RLI94656.1 MAG: phosphoglucosamine mutase [Candidatus Altiarchaeales archaeon]RLI95367.1 MAG: phosphoglucosamine mutase [Candidatus Altiarchaeales archaeon]HDO82344.1 phosphoglucosamine mutase [Candidatus Altiarchaeales archaeon]HEX54993.1 phosphoglucosamine mutase [Candidatus Altiarchaeales archaeon]